MDWGQCFVHFKLCHAFMLVPLALPLFSLIPDFWKQNTRGNNSKISVNHSCYRQIESKSTNHSPLACRKEGQKVTVVAVFGGFRSDLSITCKTESDENFGNVSVGVLFSKVVCQRKRWYFAPQARLICNASPIPFMWLLIVHQLNC